MIKASIKIISVSSSSKKAGKSSLAVHLVRELGADFGLKVSSGGIHVTPETVITDPEIIEKEGTDTGSLVAAGARPVIWVNAGESSLKEELERALSMLPDSGLLVMEGNSALQYIVPDFTVFLMTVPFIEFKPSAQSVLSRSDLVVVDRTGSFSGYYQDEIASELNVSASRARVLFFDNEAGREIAWREAAAMARERTK